MSAAMFAGMSGGLSNHRSWNPRSPQRAALPGRNSDEESGTEMQTAPQHTQTVRSMLDISESRSGIEWQVPSRPHSRERPQVPDEEMGPAFGQALSFATTRSEKIYEDIISCQYECTICADEIIHDDPMWNCNSCHHVYHFDCIQSWASNKPYPWRCPTCKMERNVAPQARCWCGNSPHSDELNHGNSCGEICKRIRKCNSTGIKCMDICSKICHPGPCDLPVCNPLCETVKTPSVAVIPSAGPRGDALGREARPYLNSRAHEPYNSRTGGRARAPRTNRPSGNRTNPPRRRSRRDPPPPLNMATVSGADLGASWFMLGILNFAFIIWVYFNVDLQTKPLENKGYIEKRNETAFVFAVVFSCLLALFNGLLAYYGARAGKNVLWKAFNLNTPQISCGKPLLKAFFTILLIAYFLGVTFWFPIAYFAAPASVYYKQMRNTCSGFDTRVPLSTPHYKLPTSHLSLYNPTLNPGNLNHPPGIDEFDLRTISHEHIHHSAPFHTFTRVAGTLAPNSTFAIDFDLHHHIYRTVSLPDASSNDTAPVINNGSWSLTTAKMPHAFLPELGLMIKDLHSFTKNCRFQPYITIFRTEGMTQAEIEVQQNRRWKGESEDNVVARTVAFGHQPRNMQVCVRRDDYTVRVKRDVEEVNEEVRRTGVLEGEREEMRDTGKYWDQCGWNMRN